MGLDILERYKDYTQPHCWQYQKRIDNKTTDLEVYGLSDEDVNNLRVSDFTFEYIPKSDKATATEINLFIERHEWLGKMSNYPTHYFVTRYKGILAGVVIMDMPNAFSKLLGVKTKKIERLISRGACISWSPKNLASSLIMFAIKWMVKNTHYRLFCAYSDPEAKELGTIYQACNFIYLGQASGAGKQYKLKNGKWVSDRYFRSRSVYKKLAIESGIIWNDTWQDGDNIKWDLIPDETALSIRQLSKNYMLSCEVRKLPKKHKYVYILGSTAKETKKLREEFNQLNPKLVNIPYPKHRGKI